MSRVIFGPLPLGAQTGYDQQLARWLVDQTTMLSRLLTRATDVTDQFSSTNSGTSVGLVLGELNSGALIPALEVTRNTDTSGYTTVELSNATRARQLELVACGSVGAYGIPANESGFNGIGGITLSATDQSVVKVKASRAFRFIPLTADPAGLEDGDVWYNSTAGKLRVRAGGVTVDLH